MTIERIYELERSASYQSGFAGVRAYNQDSVKKRFKAKGMLGTFATAHEAALERAKARTDKGQQRARHEVRSSREATLVP